jgi:hypothetical protein
MDTRKKGVASQLESRLVHDGLRVLSPDQTKNRLALLKKMLGTSIASGPRKATRRLEKVG